MGPRRGTRPPAWPSGRPAASPAVRPPRQPIRPVQGGVGFGRRPLFCSRPSVPPPSAPRRPRLRRPRRPGPNAPPCHLRAPRPRSLSCHPPRSAPEESLRRLPSPSPVVGPCRLPSQRTFLKREFSEIAFSETSFAKGAGYFLFRNVLYGGAGLFPFQKRPLRKGRAVSFSETSFAGVPDPPPPSEAPSVTLAAIWVRPCLTCRAGISHCDLWAYRRWRSTKSPAFQIRPVPPPPLPRFLCMLSVRHPPVRPYRAPRRWPS